MELIHPDHIDYINANRTTDEILLAWKNNKTYVISRLLDDPNSFSDELLVNPRLIPNSQQCLCQAGHSKAMQPLNRVFKCGSCTLLGRLIDLNTENVGIPFELHCNSHKGQEIMLMRTPITPLITGVTEHQSKHYNDYTLDRMYNMCNEIHHTELIYVGADPFINNVLISWIAEDIYEQCGIHNILTLYTMFVCGKYANSIYEYPTMGKFSTLTKIHTLNAEYVVAIIQQLCMSLRLLSNYDFIHGSGHYNNLLFTGEPCNYYYDNVSINSPFTLKLSHFKNSGISVNRESKEPVRVYSRSLMAERTMSHDKVPSKPKIDYIDITMYDHTNDDLETSEQITMYRYYSGPTFLRYFRHSGIPLFTKSFDIICFMVSFMSNKGFYDLFISVPLLVKMWNTLWRPHDLKRINGYLILCHETNNPLVRTNAIAQLLEKCWLRCDALLHIWQSLKNVRLNTVDLPV